jgi:mevalonate kinase
MPAIYATAPGKAILFGEHTVVYGQPAIAIPVNAVQARVTITALPNHPESIIIDAPQTGLFTNLKQLPETHPIAYAISLIGERLKISHWPAMHLRITSTIPVAAGLGSSAAIAVALVRALAQFAGHPLSDQQVCGLAYHIEQLQHGTPSGIDNTVITYGQPVFFVRNHPVEFLRLRNPLHLIIGDTGIHSLTREAVLKVRQAWQSDPEHYENLFQQGGRLAQEARQALEEGDLVEVGRLMNENHRLLGEIGVSCPELDRLVQAALMAGALGAKLSGGGLGGNMIALVLPHQAAEVEQALREAGAVNVIYTVIQP